MFCSRPFRRRFAIAHELGHWFLHEKESQVFVCTAERMCPNWMCLVTSLVSTSTGQDSFSR